MDVDVRGFEVVLCECKSVLCECKLGHRFYLTTSCTRLVVCYVCVFSVGDSPVVGL